MRTSQTHPLQINAVDTGPGRGLIGITFAPGKQDAQARTGSWSRDLTLDLGVIDAWKPKVVVTLLEDHELRGLRIPQLGVEVRKRNIEWLHIPIQDFNIPSRKFEADWMAHSLRLRAVLDSGENILIHCKGGLGRAGMISGRLLVELGESPDEAVAKVRAARPGAIETAAQENWVKTGSRA
jgi:hypothetical protein